ncbi:hypothetical protein HHX47_DHR4000227 [Lentinula edodes]|nr:hypothetical protein HHX47_DHR4000227 [Lentinula edodes]
MATSRMDHTSVQKKRSRSIPPQSIGWRVGNLLQFLSRGYNSIFVVIFPHSFL